MKNTIDIGNFVTASTPDSILSGLTARVKARRKALKITQKQLSTKSGVSYGSLRRFESSGEISLYSLLRIAQALDCLEDFNLLFKTPVITNLKDYKA